MVAQEPFIRDHIHITSRQSITIGLAPFKSDRAAFKLGKVIQMNLEFFL